MALPVKDSTVYPVSKKRKMPSGLIDAGNLDPTKPIAFVKNGDGSTSTVRTISIGTDRGETVIPTVSREGRIMSNPEAIDRFRSSGENFGTFSTQKAASGYANTLHDSQANLLPENATRRGGNMGISRLDLFKNTMGSEWEKNPTIGGAIKKVKGVANPPETIAPNVYNQGGQPAPAPALSKPEDIGARARSMMAQPAIEQVGKIQPKAPSQPFKSTLRDGMTYTGNDQGERTFTMGTPGQDGYGKVIAHGRTGPAGMPPTQGARQRLGNPGLSFQGSAEDAARFNAPVVGGGSGMQPTGRMIQARSTSDYLPQAPTGPQMPTYQGPESGRGWKTRAKMYEAEMDAYNKATGNATAMNIEQMREAGAGNRAMMMAGEANERNKIDRQRLFSDQQVNNLDMEGKRLALDEGKAVMDSRKKLSALDPGTPEYAKEERRLASLSGKFGEQKVPNVQMMEEPIDPSDPMSGTIKRPIRINDDGSFSRMQEAGSENKYEPLSPDKGQRKVGATYRTEDGRLVTWDGKGLKVVQQ